MHEKNIKTSGKELSQADKVLIMIHGRGGNAEDILTLQDHLHVAGYALFAPQASGNTWYPYSFLAKPDQNEPGLSSALELLKDLVEEIESQGFSSENIYFLGFSQGACLTLEFVAQNAKKYGGIAAFTGGLIGDKVYSEKYKGNFENTPIFIGTGNPDPHVPVERVDQSAEVLEKLQASVTVKVFTNRPHTISMEEIEIANKLIFK